MNDMDSPNISKYPRSNINNKLVLKAVGEIWVDHITFVDG